jgi:CheY-like chemotaxis protein
MVERVFELFAQSDAGRQQGGGLGIGLAVARKLVRAHGGHIEAHSDGVGRGSRFTIRLPHASAQPDALSNTPPPPRTAAVGRRVLIADDDRDAVEMMQNLLVQYGHELRVAFDGPSALRACEEFEPDVVFLDIGLPGMDGYEVAQRLRQLPACRSIQIVAVSGYARDEDRNRALASGCTTHLAKPFDVETLSKIVEGVQRA